VPIVNRHISEGFQILLDTRPVRKADKSVLTIPHSKPHLATAIALEWDHLVMAAQALKQHYIPLTSLTSRAHDIAAADAAAAAKTPGSKNDVRDAIVNMLMGYLRTDTLLCWTPEKTSYADFDGTTEDGQAASDRSLRDMQEAVAKPIVAHLTSCVWPGVELHPALDDGSIVPRHQPEETQAVVRGWLGGLPSWDLAGLERAVLASKSLCVGARLVVEWSGAFKEQREAWSRGGNTVIGSLTERETTRFAVEEAAEACSQEVLFQTRNWGEVEDTHDVNKEDLRRQLGSTVLLVHDH
jgi:chaperone required for assembly of F1-ATPase